MGTFDRQIVLAQQQIEAKGEPCTWNITTGPTVGNPSQPWITQPSEPAGVSVFILFKSDKETGYRIVGDSNTQKKVSKGVMAAVAFTPKLTDTVIRSDGSVLTIDDIDPVCPNGQTIIYNLRFLQ